MLIGQINRLIGDEFKLALAHCFLLTLNCLKLFMLLCHLAIDSSSSAVQKKVHNLVEPLYLQLIEPNASSIYSAFAALYCLIAPQGLMGLKQFVMFFCAK